MLEQASVAADAGGVLTLRRRDIAAALLGLGLAALFLVGGAIAPGIVLLALAVFFVATRAGMRETPGIAGAFARRRGVLGQVATFALLVVLFVVVGTLVVAGLEQWTPDAHDFVAVCALFGVVVLLYGEIDRRSEDAARWQKGARAEDRVGEELAPLRDRGWIVFHDVLTGRGNVDHVVTGPSGAFAIETKSGPFRRADIGQAAANAAWVKERLGVRWVNAVLCVDDEAQAPMRSGVVSVVDVRQLRSWLENGGTRA